MSASTEPGLSGKPILFIDAYDSFANNIVALLERELERKVVKIFIDHSISDLPAFVQQFSAVVIGPGPGTVENDQDVGIINDIWTLPDASVLPVFGICLGFQSLVLKHGGAIKRLPHPRHGIEMHVESSGRSIFKGIERFSAVQYHSLHGVLGHEGSTEAGRTSGTLFESAPSTPDLVPLAWDFAASQERENEIGLHPDESYYIPNPDRILMAVSHATKPFFGVQFHPESICSSPQARQLVRNWWREAQRWTQQRPCESKSRFGKFVLSSLPPFVSIEEQPSKDKTAGLLQTTPPQVTSTSLLPPTLETADGLVRYSCRCLPTSSHSVPTIVSALGLINDDEEAVILDTARPVQGVQTRSIIGCIDNTTLHVTYTVASDKVALRRGRTTWMESLKPYGSSIFSFLKVFMSQHRLDATGPDDSSNVFSGGFVGYIDYEACLETIDVQPSATPGERPNLHFVFVERSVLLDTETHGITIQSIRKDDEAWLNTANALLSPQEPEVRLQVNNTTEPITRPSSAAHHLNTAVASPYSVSPSTRPLSESDDTDYASDFQLEKSYLHSVPAVKPPTEHAYRAKISQCQRELHAGNSYELCLTDQTQIQVPFPNKSSWALYRQLRTINPAPFAAYMRLGPLTLMSSSPERFMSWSRPSKKQNSNNNDLTSVCQFRPIKGTVKKRAVNPDGSVRIVTLEEATAILSTQKERAENLMIVDLIRHDMYGVAGAGNVDVPRLMVVEEYEHVYQLVSVIEGRLTQQPALLPSPTAENESTSRSGIDVLACSLPPGSMTGAPKKRSCELLTGIEQDQPRSVYAGVLGYMDVGGGGDFSVVIRTIFRWDDECDAKNGGSDVWRVGAGGAITVLSTEEGEWEEMKAKLSTVLGLFGGGV